MSLSLRTSVRIASLIVSLFSQSAIAERWNGSNDPSIMDPNFVYQLKQLPLEGRLDFTPWSETYWASKQGSINLRWNQPNPVGFNYHSPTRQEAMQMSREQLARLAPSEKYDLYMGRYDYPLKNEVEGIATPSAKWWSGICDGWSLATLQYKEPKVVEMVNPDGIVIPFGSSDVKGLMSYAAARHFDVETKQVGGRCSGIGGVFGSASCADINAGSLHVILANQIGLKKQGFVTEIDPGKEVWNQATYGFKFNIVGSANSRHGAYGVRVQATLYYADELEVSSWEPVVGTPNNVEGKLELDYTLDLDSSGNIIGGKFHSGTRPDFVWLPTNHLEFKDYLDGINKIYVPN